MQSKLPVRIKNKFEENKCCCNKLFELIIQNPTDPYYTCCVRKESSLDLTKSNQSMYSRCVQTEAFLDTERKSLNDIKCILVTINTNLETILVTLQDKKELLYNKLQEESQPSKKNKPVFGKSKMEKFKISKNVQSVRKFSYGGWPDISRLYYGQPSYLKNYMQIIAAGLEHHKSSSLVIASKSHGWIYNGRPSSCPNINYFQLMGNLLRKRPPVEIPMLPAPAYTIGQGDLSVMDSRGRGDNPEENHEDKDETKNST